MEEAHYLMQPWHAIELAMQSIEHYKPELQGSLPKDEYYRLTRTEETRHLPFALLRQFDKLKGKL